MPNKELTTETRLLLAFVLVGIVLVGWNYIYKPPVVVGAGHASPGRSAEAARAGNS